MGLATLRSLAKRALDYSWERIPYSGSQFSSIYKALRSLEFKLLPEL